MRPSGSPEVRSRLVGKNVVETHSVIGQGPKNGKDGPEYTLPREASHSDPAARGNCQLPVRDETMHATLAFILVAMPSLRGGRQCEQECQPAVEQRRGGDEEGERGWESTSRVRLRGTRKETPSMTRRPRPAGSYYATDRGQECDASPLIMVTPAAGPEEGVNKSDCNCDWETGRSVLVSPSKSLV
jgi:hypothetical protein